MNAAQPDCETVDVGENQWNVATCSHSNGREMVAGTWMRGFKGLEDGLMYQNTCSCVPPVPSELQYLPHLQSPSPQHIGLLFLFQDARYPLQTTYMAQLTHLTTPFAIPVPSDCRMTTSSWPLLPSPWSLSKIHFALRMLI